MEQKQRNQIDMGSLFMDLQAEMQASLILGRYFPHPGERGTHSESAWIKWLRTYLPKRYRVDKAQVIDCYGNLSEQIDIVIYDDQYSHFVFNSGDQKYVPAESVFAVLEVKQDFTRGHLEAACQKAESVRRLHRTSVPIRQISGKYIKKDLHDILAGIVALKTTWDDPLGNTFEKNLAELTEEKDRRLNFGCALESGAFFAEYEPTLQIKKSIAEESLVFFFLQLLVCLQGIGNPPGIDFSEYAKNLKTCSESLDEEKENTEEQ